MYINLAGSNDRCTPRSLLPSFRYISKWRKKQQGGLIYVNTARHNKPFTAVPTHSRCHKSHSTLYSQGKECREPDIGVVAGEFSCTLTIVEQVWSKIKSTFFFFSPVSRFLSWYFSFAQVFPLLVSDCRVTGMRNQQGKCWVLEMCSFVELED